MHGARPLSHLLLVYTFGVGCATASGVAGLDGSDAGLADAGAIDAGTSIDAGPSTDAGAFDAGSATDGGTSRGDGGGSDSGTTDDGGSSDGGASIDGGGDAGATTDAGVESDAGPAGDGGVGSACTASRDCGGGLVCGDLRDFDGGVSGACTAPRASPPAHLTGEHCAADAECRENICLDTITGLCSALCRDAALDCPANHACTTYTVNARPLGFCNPSCVRDADCAAFTNNVCSINSNTMTALVDRVCQLPTGPGVLGGACSGGGDCRSGVCLTTTTVTGTSCTDDTQCAPGRCGCPQGGTCAPADQRCITADSRCTVLCATAADCATSGQPLTACGPVTVSVTGGGASAIDLCVEP
jgi:hypothetical protein